MNFFNELHKINEINVFFLCEHQVSSLTLSCAWKGQPWERDGKLLLKDGYIPKVNELKGNALFCLIMCYTEGILGSGGIGPCIPNLRNKWGEGEHHA